jgi:hypothetical protein
MYVAEQGMKEHTKALEAVGAFHHGVRESGFFRFAESLEVVERSTGAFS